ncbi:MAG: TetR/AcrR family transcriptional regulator, partial [Pseudonocardia sp.]|nr:TetR/AcrR family transcriptional regulator [Pseudonocardia sp.]
MTNAARVRRPSHGPGSLLEVAVGEFNTRGYDATSMEDLSRAAGITKSSFYHHFAGKEALLRAALELAIDGLFALLDSEGARTGSPLTRLRHIVRGQVEV